MARERSSLRDKAYSLYKKKKKLIDISKELDIPEGTIRSWKNRYNWDNKDNATLQNNKTNNCNVANSERKSKRINKEPIADEVKSLMKDEELSEKHRLFCVIYSKCMNATKAYQRVYHCAYWTAAVNGNALLKNTKIKNAINMMVESDLNKEFLKPGLIQRYKDIAFSDIGDYLEFGIKQVPQWEKNKDGIDIPVVDPNTGEQKINEYSYVKLKNSVGLDTSIISEVSEGKDGIKFKLADKMKAMDVLAKLSNLLSDEEKTKLDIEYKKIQALKLQADIIKTKAETARIASKGNGNDSDGEIENMLRGIKDGL